MGRPPLPLGTAGVIRTYRETNGTVTATCQVRDYDGKVRRMERTRRTKGSAERALKEALRDRIHVVADSDITPDTKLAVVAEQWHVEVKRTDVSPSTVQSYRYRLDGQVLPGMGELRMREVSVAAVSRFILSVEAKHGSATAKVCKTVVSGICKFAAKHNAISQNPTRDSATLSTKPKRKPRSLTAEAAKQLRALLSYDPCAVRRDLPDFADMMLATGLRIGETAAIVWDAINLDARTVEVRGTVLRLKGKGLVIKSAPKTEEGFRTLELAPWCLDMLQRRAKEDHEPDDPVFTAPRGGLRDPSNTQADLREAFDLAGYDWLTSHTFRRTMATLMDEAGLSARAAADQLGHAMPSMTQDRYMGRKVRATGAAKVVGVLDFEERG